MYPEFYVAGDRLQVSRKRTKNGIFFIICDNLNTLKYAVRCL